MAVSEAANRIEHKWNRDSFKIFNDAGDTQEEKLKAFRMLSAANVGESIDIIQNFDYIIILARWGRNEVANDDDGTVYCAERFLMVKLVSCRGKLPKKDAFMHRFLTNNDMCLEQDINSPRPKSIDADFDSLAVDKAKIPYSGASRGPRSIKL